MRGGGGEGERGSARGRERGWDGEVYWRFAAGGCCALHFTSGVSGVFIHAVLCKGLFVR